MQGYYPTSGFDYTQPRAKVRGGRGSPNRISIAQSTGGTGSGSFGTGAGGASGAASGAAWGTVETITGENLEGLAGGTNAPEIEDKAKLQFCKFEIT